MKTLDITAKEWFDKAAGNSYFIARITVDAGYPTERIIALPFQYGYGEQYTYEALQELIKRSFIPHTFSGALWRYCSENNIILSHRKIEDCKQKDVKFWGHE